MRVIINVKGLKNVLRQNAAESTLREIPDSEIAIAYLTARYNRAPAVKYRTFNPTPHAMEWGIAEEPPEAFFAWIIQEGFPELTPDGEECIALYTTVSAIMDEWGDLGETLPKDGVYCFSAMVGNLLFVETP